VVIPGNPPMSTALRVQPGRDTCVRCSRRVRPPARCPGGGPYVRSAQESGDPLVSAGQAVHGDQVWPCGHDQVSRWRRRCSTTAAGSRPAARCESRCDSAPVRQPESRSRHLLQCGDPHPLPAAVTQSDAAHEQALAPRRNRCSMQHLTASELPVSDWMPHDLGGPWQGHRVRSVRAGNGLKDLDG
jgi:hypothetical protein